MSLNVLGYQESPDGGERIEVLHMRSLRPGWTFHPGKRIPNPPERAVIDITELASSSASADEFFAKLKAEAKVKEAK